jgi:hypothetical protein
MGFVNWRQVAQDRGGWRKATGRHLSFLDSTATEEGGKEEDVIIMPWQNLCSINKFLCFSLREGSV